MEQQQTQKWANLSYLGLGALLGYIVYSVAIRFSQLYDWEAHFADIELAISGFSVLMGVALYWGLRATRRSNQFMNEVVAELLKVTWPTVKESYRSTFLVIVMVLIAGVVLGGLDAVWTWLMQWLI